MSTRPLIAPRACEFFVPGKPQQKGSKTPMRHKTTGELILIDANRKAKPWQRLVSGFACRAWKHQPSARAMSVGLEFVFARPRSHYRTGRFSHLLRADAPEHHRVKPDLDKLQRPVLDALTSVVYVDDCQVCFLGPGPRKVYGDVPGVRITVSEL